MSEEKSPDWLPAGWTVERKVRKNGRKDMCYIDPSNKLKFYSKPEVLRYLKKEQENSRPKTSVRKGTSKHVEDNVCYHKRKSTSEHVEDNVFVEKIVPEELPPGWTKEFKITKRGRNIRKDAFYTDPVTGYIFRSLKDVNRYLKTGDVGKHAFKPKDDSHIDLELKDEKLTAEGEKSVDERTNGQIAGDHSSKLVETENDELTLESTDIANAACISENASEPCKENVVVGDVNIPEASGLDAKEEKTEKELKEKQATQGKKKKSRNESKPGLPRRASKRLAGVDIDLPREPKARRQATAGRASEVRTRSACLASSVESEMKGTTDNSSNEKQVNTTVLLHGETLPNLGKHVEEVETDTKPKERQDGNAEVDKKTNEKQQLPIVLTPGSHTTSKEHGCNFGTDNKSCVYREAAEVKRSTTSEEHGAAKHDMDNIPNEKLEIPNNLPLTRVSTSTEDEGKRVEPDNNNKSFAKQELSSVSPLAEFIIPGEYPGNMVTDNNSEMKPESPGNLSLSNLWADPCIEFAVKTLTGDIPVCEENRVDTFSGPPLEMPLGGLWADPCIEFAVKTLTGAIPVGEDLNVQQYFQQHACSTENHGANSPTLLDVGLNNLSQAQFVSQPFNTQQNPLNKQPESVFPMLPSHRNGSLQLPNTGRQQHGKGNNGECSRKAFF